MQLRIVNNSVIFVEKVMQNFENLKVWQDAMELAVLCYKVTNNFPDSEKFGLTSQMRRCSVSISSNIAEGCGRESSLEMLNFLRIASGSAYEMHSQTILSVKLGLLNKEEGEHLIEKIVEEKK